MVVFAKLLGGTQKILHRRLGCDGRNGRRSNGGFNPAYNVQFATDGEARIIVAEDVTNAGTDGGELLPLLDQIEADYGRRSEQALVDSAYATKAFVTAAEQAGTQVISTVPRAEQLKKHGKDPHEKQPGDTDEFAAFRTRMADPANQEIYKQWPSIVCGIPGLDSETPLA